MLSGACSLYPKGLEVQKAFFPELRLKRAALQHLRVVFLQHCPLEKTYIICRFSKILPKAQPTCFCARIEPKRQKNTRTHALLSSSSFFFYSTGIICPLQRTAGGPTNTACSVCRWGASGDVFYSQLDILLLHKSP